MKKVYLHLTLLITLMAVSDAAFAQEDTLLNNFSLKQLLNVKVMTASRTSQNLETAPASVIVITREQIKLRGYQSLLDVMHDLPDVKVDDKIYSGIRNSITFRGTQGSEKMVFLMDGVIISSPSGEAMPVMENYPVNLAEQIEIVYGPASALYGANAVSAVVNIITKKPSKKNMVAEASTLADHYGYTNTSVFLSKKFADHVNLTVSGQYLYDKGVDYTKLYGSDPLYSVTPLKTGIFNTIYGPVTPLTPVRPKFEAPIEAYNVYMALRIQNFSFTFFRNQFTLPTAWSNNTSNAVYNKEVRMSQSVSVANATYRKTIGDITTTTALTMSEYNLDPKSNYRNMYTGMEPAYKYSTASMGKIEQQVDFVPSDKINLSAGIGYEQYHSIPQSADLSAPVNTNDYIHSTYLGTKAFYNPGGVAAQFYFLRYHNVGTFVQSTWSPNDQWHITLGARHDWNSRYGSTFNPRMGVVYKASEKTMIKVLFGSAFLAPMPSDSYAQYGSFYTTDSGRTYRSSFLHLPNPDLKPIRSRNVELSIIQNLTENIALTVNGYYTFLSGLHRYADDNVTTKRYNNQFNGIPVDYVEVFTNNNRQMNYGASLVVNGKHEWGKVQLNSFASLSYVNGKLEEGLTERQETELDRESDFIAPFMGHLGFELKAGKFSCSPRLTLMGTQRLPCVADTVNNIIQRQTIPGYALLNVSVRYAFNKNVAGFINISNALNQRYRAVSFNMDLNNPNTELFYGQRQDPIRIMAGFKWEL